PRRGPLGGATGADRHDSTVAAGGSHEPVAPNGKGDKGGEAGAALALDVLVHLAEKLIPTSRVGQLRGRACRGEIDRKSAGKAGGERSAGTSALSVRKRADQRGRVVRVRLDQERVLVLGVTTRLGEGNDADHGRALRSAGSRGAWLYCFRCAAAKTWTSIPRSQATNCLKWWQRSRSVM